MRKIRQVLRLFHDNHQSQRSIASSLSLSRSTVTDYITRAAATSLGWPLPEDMDDAALEQSLFPINPIKLALLRPKPDCAVIHQEMKRKGATLAILHEEYLETHHDGIGYSLFCEHYREYKKLLTPSMRQTYQAGERVFVDYAGPTMKVVDIGTGNIQYAQIFVAVLGASNYIYAEAHWSQQIPDWIAAHLRMFEHFGGVPAIVVCDNLKSAVTKASRREPVINTTYQNLADHYGTIIFPARAYKPKDKAKAENGVLIVERWIMFRLRKRIFTSLGELNVAIQALLVEVNHRPFKKLPGSRQSAFESIDLPALLPLPATPFIYAEFRKVRVGMDYHVEVNRYYFSVPNQLCRKEVGLRITATTVEVLHLGKRVASHIRNPFQKVTTEPEHMTDAHRQFGLWQPDHALEWARQTGEHVHLLMQQIFDTIRIHDQGYRANLTFKKLAQEYGDHRLNAACLRLMSISTKTISTHSLGSLRSILRNSLDQQPLAANEHQEATFDHPNIRGANYYH